MLPRSQNQKERAVAEKQGPREKSKAQPRDETENFPKNEQTNTENVAVA